MIFSKLVGVFRNKSKESQSKVSHRIYGTVVAQARNSTLYREFNIPDTVMGRYEMLSLHIFLLNHRLKNTPPDKSEKSLKLSQDVFDLFVLDLERGLRDIGFADTSVHKRKKRLIHSYYALIDEFDRILGGKNMNKLAQPVASRFFSDFDEPAKSTNALALASYMKRVVKSLRAQKDEILQRGEITWPTVHKV